MKIKLFYNEEKDTTFIRDILGSSLKSAGLEVTEKDKFDIGIAIGGDGTFLHMVMKSNFRSNALFVGINNGTLGFLQEVKPNEIKRFVNDLKKKKYRIEELSYEKVTIYSGKKKTTYNALNEVVVRDAFLKTAYLDIKINDETLENFVGDGLMVSTPTGSTSYNLSSGGAIVYNGLNVLEITPLAPINNYIYRTLSNSVIIPDTRDIKIVPVKRTSTVSIFIDGMKYDYEHVDKIDVSLSKDKIKVIRLDDYDYTKIIFNKFLK